jgi:hypothetical protein
MATKRDPRALGRRQSADQGAGEDIDAVHQQAMVGHGLHPRRKPSWNGVVKLLDPSRYDQLFVLVGDGRRWLMPANVVGGGNLVRLGGPKYADYEIDTGHPLPAWVSSLDSAPLGGIPERSKGMRCKRIGSAFPGSNPGPATPGFTTP